MIQKSQNSENRTAIFPGSFDPFTVGHYSIVMRALQMFDRIVVAVGVNDVKKPMFTATERVAMIEECFAGEPRVCVVTYSGLTVDAAKEVGAQCILRGVRMIQDFEYEKNLAEINRSLAGIETVLLYTLPNQSHISSSVVRELLHYGRDVSSLLPPGVTLPWRSFSNHE